MKACTSMCAVLWVLLLTGCAHLEQAPLVYASKSSFGVDISSASTENPGLSVNLGYKQIDAAYVPVAVARACRETYVSGASAQPCTGPQYQLQLITGSAREGQAGPEGVSEEAKIEEAGKAYLSYTKALEGEARAKELVDVAELQLGQLRDRHATLSDQKKQYEQYAAELKSLGDLSAQTGGTDLGMSDESARKKDAAEKNADKYKLDEEQQAFLSTYEKAEKAARDAAIAARSEYVTRQNQVQLEALKLKSANSKVAQSNLGDSYSVFGSFDGASSTDSSGKASIGLGKMFSTGVAAQRLAASLSAVACYNLIKEKAPSGVSASELDRLLQRCE